MSLKMAHKVILPPKKNYIPQFLKQRDINSYCHLLCQFFMEKEIEDIVKEHGGPVPGLFYI
jgi:hypothetical protein